MRKYFVLFIVLLFYFPATIFAASKSKEKNSAKKEVKQEKSKVDKIRLVLKYGTPEQVAEALKKIPKLKEEDRKKLIPDLKESLKSEFVSVQIKTIHLLQRIKNEVLSSDIENMYPSKNEDLQIAILQYFQKKKYKNLGKKILGDLTKEDFTKVSRLIREQIQTLAKNEDKIAVSFLVDKLKDEDTHIENKKSILLYLGEVKASDKKSKEILKKIFENKDENLTLRSYAVNAIGKAGYQDMLASIQEKIKEIDQIADIDEKRKYARFKVYLLSALIQLKDKDVIPTLMKMSKSPEAGVRRRAIKQLGDLKVQEAVELLKFKKEYDPNPKVRKEAKLALEKITGKKESKTKSKNSKK